MCGWENKRKLVHIHIVYLVQQDDIFHVLKKNVKNIMTLFISFYYHLDVSLKIKQNNLK